MTRDQNPELHGEHPVVEYSMNRREFLGFTGTGILLYFVIGELPVFAEERPAVRPQMILPADFNAFLRIGEDGRVGCYTGKIEMGQGIVTSLAQMLADELDTSFDTVQMVMGDTELCPWDLGTFGSMSTRFFGQALRSAGAEARLILLELASERLKTPVDSLMTNQGIIVDKKNKDRRVSYGELARGQRFERHLVGKAPLKKSGEFTVMGRPVVRRDAGEKVTGKAIYAGDVQIPGMVYAKILRPPAHDAKLVDVDPSEAERVNGLQIIRSTDFIAVLHKYPDVAELALSKIKAKFDSPPSRVDEKTIFNHLFKMAPEGTVLAKEGDLGRGAKMSSVVIEQTYLNDYVAHAPIEPHAAVVKIEGDRATVWASTQNPFGVKEEVAREIGIPPNNVRVMPVFVGGGFGGKTNNRQVVEAARCSKLCGKPVQVAWTRKEEFFYDTFRPAAMVTIKSGLTDKGRISFWDYHVYFAGERGALHFYTIPHHSTIVHSTGWQGTPGSHPIATGPWRAPGNNTNTFARESQIDIMAKKARVDPLEFRMQNLSDPKLLRVLSTAAEKFGWKRAKAPSGRGQGVACGLDAGTYVAVMAEIAVEQETGAVKVKRIVCVQDMGLAVNPEGAALQMEGAVTMGLGYALQERVRFMGGNISEHNFDTYYIPRFTWVPKIQTVIIDDKNSAPQGGGEPAIITTGAVIANAIYDAIGVRLNQLPMTPERIMEAMKKK
ncbi:MAG TPA: molybdopterin cofactor-binding domain-containing protein [Nitrospirota bacterium]|nr:molybdopterin cofactor-binding domain-containing protein [Nitrospirota bacterium]